MTTVASVRGFRGVLADTILIDRTSAYGNFPGRRLERYAAIEAFRLYWYHSDQRSLRWRARRELTGKTLLCHCSPLPCHGDVIAGYLNLVCPFLERQSLDVPCPGETHTWTMYVDADPDPGTPCDCTGKRWGQLKPALLIRRDLP